MQEGEEFDNNTIYDINFETLYHHDKPSKDTKQLARIQIEDRNALHAFTVLCLRHMVGVMTWKLKHRNTRISDVFSVSDETLALVTLENDALICRIKAYGKSATDTSAHYMK